MVRPFRPATRLMDLIDEDPATLDLQDAVLSLIDNAGMMDEEE